MMNLRLRMDSVKVSPNEGRYNGDTRYMDYFRAWLC